MENDNNQASGDEEGKNPRGMPIFTTANCKPLDVDSVVDILKNAGRYGSIACDAIPSGPKAGNVFLFVPKSEADLGEEFFLSLTTPPKARLSIILATEKGS